MSQPEERCFAIAHSRETVDLIVDLPAISAQPPELGIAEPAFGCGLLYDSAPHGRWRYRLRIPPAKQNALDDELRLCCTDKPAGTPGLIVVVRRTSCKISTTLLEQANPLWPQTRSALLWYGWGRFQELCGLKRFTSGMSGCDVVVFRPRLTDPDLSGTPLGQGEMAGVIREAWGSCLVVKTGPKEEIEEEWQRFDRFLVNRLHPFMARSEDFLTTLPADEPTNKQGTLIGSFLGGDLVQVESFQTIVRSAPDSQPCLAVLRKLFAITATWYAGSAVQPLGMWYKMFRRSETEPFLPAGNYAMVAREAPGDWYDVPVPDVPLALFGRFDLTQEKQRREYHQGVEWDTSFITREHLINHLLGKNRDGLLYRLMGLPVRYSLTHGDLHTNNILADRDNVWLIDFGETCVAPTLWDFAKLEIYLRLWCLDMGAHARNLDDAARLFERQLLDFMTGSEGGLGAVQELAGELGVERSELLKIAQCICEIRRLATAYTQGTPDRRDYLAVLYLTVLNSLQFASKKPDLTDNFQLLLGLSWVLEESLSRIVGIKPYDRHRIAFEPRYLLKPAWLGAPGAPGRIRYFLDRLDGQEALAPLAATRGVLQNQAHHLDVLDHTLLVMAYVEELMGSADPLAGFLDPADLDRRVQERLQEQQLFFPPVASAPDPARPDMAGLEGTLEPVRTLLKSRLHEEAGVLLKWAVLFHDVGKPATRSVNLPDSKKDKKGRIQFLGHEIYSQRLAADHLAFLFPDQESPGQRERVSLLIRRHLDPLQLVHHYAQEKADVYPELKAAMATGRIPKSELNYLKHFWDEQGDKYTPDFTLLILHGFADSLATRGSESKRPFGQVAEILLVLLRLYVWYEGTIRNTEVRKLRFKELTKNFNEKLRMDGPALGRMLAKLEQWYMAETSRREADGQVEVTQGELLAKARQEGE